MKASLLLFFRRSPPRRRRGFQNRENTLNSCARCCITTLFEILTSVQSLGLSIALITLFLAHGFYGRALKSIFGAIYVDSGSRLVNTRLTKVKTGPWPFVFPRISRNGIQRSKAHEVGAIFTALNGRFVPLVSRYQSARGDSLSIIRLPSVSNATMYSVVC